MASQYLRSFWGSRILWLSILIPLIALPLPLLYPTSVAKCGYCVIVTGFFWVTEILPLPVTSLFPIFLFPMWGIMTAKQVCMSYVKDTLMLFLGSLVVAVAVERWNLHKRLALRTLTLVGPQPQWLLLGIMLPCWFLSMWMSNTATTAMMMPIVIAILEQIKNSKYDKRQRVDGDEHCVKLVMTDSGKETQQMVVRNRAEEEMEQEEFSKLAKVFSLATAFAANIGGVATLTGTPPNVIFKGLADTLYEAYGETSPVNFANWLVVGLPLSVICLAFCWLWMGLYAQGLGCFRCCAKDESFVAVKRKIWDEYKRLGRMTFAEVVVFLNFVLLALLWVTRNPGFMPGWSCLFKKGYVEDSTPAILIAVLLFVLPSRRPRWTVCFRSKKAKISEVLEPTPAFQPILTWKVVNERMAWGVLLLMGGGFALADGCQISGLSQWVSGHLEGLGSLSPWLICFLLTLFIAIATEVTSNAATTTLFVPIAGDLAVQLGVNPLYFMIPATISASLAFLLPVATPPNAIVFASGYLRVRDMVLVGFPINVFALAVLNLAANTWAVPAFDLFNLPEVFLHNVTSLSSSAAPLNISLSP